MRERCGVIIGDTFYEIRNIAHNDYEFLMDPEQLYDLLIKFGHIDAIVHTHVFGCYPSDNDIQFMKLWNEQAWIIVSRECIKGYRYDKLSSSVFKININTLVSQKLYNLIMKLLE